MQNKTLYREEDFERYTRLKNVIQQTVQRQFEITAAVRLTKPTFFSLISDKNAVTEHDEYWHDHVDKVTRCSFHPVLFVRATRLENCSAYKNIPTLAGDIWKL
jgi:hypothetical protein